MKSFLRTLSDIPKYSQTFFEVGRVLIGVGVFLGAGLLMSFLLGL